MIAMRIIVVNILDEVQSQSHTKSQLKFYSPWVFSLYE